MIQSGVIIDDGPTLEEVIADETSEKEAPDTSDNELAPISEALGEESTSITPESPEIDTEELQTSSVEEGESESIKGEEPSDLSTLSQKLKPELVEISKSLDIDHSGTKNEIIERIYDSQNVSQLKELLKEQGKPVSGKKSDLILRLME